MYFGMLYNTGGLWKLTRESLYLWELNKLNKNNSDANWFRFNWVLIETKCALVEFAFTSLEAFALWIEHIANNAFFGLKAI
jgi:hypothetical protein